MDLNGQVAVVTGASRGIGRAIAEKLHAAGADVVLVARNETLLEETASTMGGAMVVPMDVSSADEVEAGFRSIINEKGKIDILVNNAGITRDNLLLRLKEEDIQQVLDVNLKSMFFTSKNVLRSMMKQRRGRIINITSVIGLMGNAGQSNYAASKAGIIGFTKSLAREVGSRNITVNAVAPGFIETDMTAELSENVQKEMAASIALGRFGSTEDVANAVLFLASDLAAYVTGDVMNVTGGMYM
ncbi:MAG: 3-oxoacyl-[acyl-carrier-protein] reductase [Acidobacteria bacterium CG_4_9_14_3_um_filter_49_7]|nr:MAG: 3-oxoacyl-[acyl-carrier-protein] reductase [Acidobacteria bacterium CG_4_9_14_3_um_filter_49_7]